VKKYLFLLLTCLTGCLAPTIESEKETDPAPETKSNQETQGYPSKEGPPGCGVLSQEFEIIVDGKIHQFSIVLPCTDKWQDPSDPAPNDIAGFYKKIEQIGKQE
jgi:hypothetical protein